MAEWTRAEMEGFIDAMVAFSNRPDVDRKTFGDFVDLLRGETVRRAQDTLRNMSRSDPLFFSDPFLESVPHVIRIFKRKILKLGLGETLKLLDTGASGPPPPPENPATEKF